MSLSLTVRPGRFCASALFLLLACSAPTEQRAPTDSSAAGAGNHAGGTAGSGGGLPASGTAGLVSAGTGGGSEGGGSGSGSSAGGGGAAGTSGAATGGIHAGGVGGGGAPSSDGGAVSNVACPMIASKYASELDKQLACNPSAGSQCDDHASAAPGCECEVFIQPADPFAIEHLSNMANDWFVKDCSMPSCPAKCSTAVKGTCQADAESPLGGRCITP